MIHKVFAVYDGKAEAYGMPIFLPTIGLALRSFEDQCNNPESPMAMHPEDYGLFHLGDYDQEKGKFMNLEQPKHLGMALEFTKKSNGG